jgi:DNA-binding NarL/FixJ family response regulator
MVRILIVDDHLAIRVGLTSILSTQHELEIIGSAASGEEALLMLERQMPDILLLDLRMQHMDGISLLEEIVRRRYPVRTIVLTSYETDEDVYRAVNAGALGYLLKDSSEEELVDAILAVYSGKIYLPQHIASRLVGRMRRASLSTREVEVLGMMAKGLTNKQIATALGISDHTVRSHVANITGKLEVADRTEAVTIAIRLGVLQLN